MTTHRQEAMQQDGSAGVPAPYLNRIWRASAPPNGGLSDGPASSVTLSVDGRLVGFTSAAENLTSNDRNGYSDVFLFDNETNQLRLISANPQGQSGDSWSGGPALSADGRTIAFYSWAGDLTAGDTNAVQDLFAYDMDSHAIERLSKSPDGSPANDRSGDSRPSARPAISADGRIIAFHSMASNLVEGDDNRAQDIFVVDRVSDMMHLVSVSSQGDSGNADSRDPALSANGQWVAFSSHATNLDVRYPNPEGFSQIYLHDRQHQMTRMISVALDGGAGNGNASAPALSGNGQLVAFASEASNLVTGDNNSVSDIFVFDLQTEKLERISVDTAGIAGNRDSWAPTISLDGQFVAFLSDATNLVNGDSNLATDVFVHDRLARHTMRVSMGLRSPGIGVEANGPTTGPPAISSGGRQLAYLSQATNLIDGRSESTEPDVVDMPVALSQEVYLVERAEMPTYSIDGLITDAKNRPLPGVEVIAGPHSTLTDEDGSYRLDHLPGGVYTIRALGQDHRFSPERKQVSVHTPVANVDFRGMTNGRDVSPVLSLPLSVPITMTMLQALRDTEEGGWIDAWFDHDAPDYEKNDSVTLWDGQVRQSNGYNRQLGCYERRCYDGHDGTDFPYRDPDPATKAYEPLTVHAAAPGTIVHRFDTCEIDDRWCNGGYGNEIIVLHTNSVFTRYSHLASPDDDSLPLYSEVGVGEILGVMGSTGNSYGVHLHFAVHQDDGNGRWDGEETDLPVDPFGWSGDTIDPWAGSAPSVWIWQERPKIDRFFFGSHGGSLEDPTGVIRVNIPPGAMSGQVRIELEPGTPTDMVDPALRRLGQPFTVRVLDWYPADGEETDLAELDSAIVEKTLQLEIAPNRSEMAHIHMQRATIARWDDLDERWLPLPTAYDPQNGVIRGDTDQFGIFDLQAPLLCADDSFEPDDRYFDAIYMHGGSDTLVRLLDTSDDEDWLRFEANRDADILVRVDDLAPELGLAVELVGTDGLTVLEKVESAEGQPVTLNFKATDEGTYFIRVTPLDGSSVGCQARYTVSLLNSTVTTNE